jgi:3-dehydroquinate dehydratase/shikimate dehydrogenase
MIAQGARDLASRVKSNGSKVIASYHDLKGTPASTDLARVLDSGMKIGADVCKIITTATGPRDNLRVLNFLSEKSADVHLVSFAMGSAGVPSRILGPLFGGEFTFAALSQDTKTAEGQLTIDEVRSVWQLLGIK